jgi:sugar phosphate isomerase/epimerase
MQPSVWTSFLIDQTPEEMIRTFAAHGWHVLEMSDEHAQMLLERGAPAAAGEALRATAASEGVSFPQGHLWLHSDLCGLDGRMVMDTLRRWLDLFVGLGIRAAVLHPGGRAMAEAGAGPEAIRAVRVERLASLCDHVRDAGVSICLENVPNCPEVDDLLAIITAVGRDNLGICLDTGHLNMASGDQAGFIRGAGAYLRATHLADNEGLKDQHLMPFERGTVDWPAVMGALGAIGYRGLANLEIPGESHGMPLAIRRAKLDYLQRVMDYLLELGAGPAA